MIKILVVDDEEFVRRGIVMETDWKALDCVVIAEASNGIEGITAVEQYHPDVIICDIRMPKLNGIDMMTQLREKGIETPVIFLTAYSDFEYARSAIKLSAVDYLLKPFEDKELEQSILRVKKKMNELQSSSENNDKYDIEHLLKLPKGNKSKYVDEALSFIAESLDNPNLCVSMITEHLGLSEGHLSHIFKKETSYTINAYVTRYRIREAMRLLQDCRIKVYEVAEKVGYRDITYFSTVFKKLTGVNPSEYQDRCGAL